MSSTSSHLPFPPIADAQHPYRRRRRTPDQSTALIGDSDSEFGNRDGEDTRDSAYQTGEAATRALADFAVDSRTDEFGVVPSAGSSSSVADGTAPNAGFLFAKFRAFYNEVIRFQHQKSEFSAGFATAMMADAADPGPETAANALSRRLRELLELQAAEAKWMGGEAAVRYPDAQYAMAALADEIFTYSEWEGQSAWPKYRLEQKIYRTHCAEVDVFDRIDTLLKECPDTAVGKDLARVYLLVLAAGFQGKWRPFGLARAVAEYRQRLYEYIHAGDAMLLFAPDRRVFPDAVSRTLEGHAVARYSAAQRWAAVLVILATIYLVVSHVAWSRSSSDLRDVTTRIKSLAPSPGEP